ncbi:MAG TPA: hypothetical protein VNQ77_11305 [Frankiaceae bacterium]|nr:hypothetical protein [Frankiaceae bacterium]
MPRLRTLLAVVLVAAGLAVPAAADVRQSAWLLVRAERNASVDITFRTAVTVLRGHVTTPDQNGWAGYYLQPLTRPGHDGFGQVWLPALHGKPPAAFAVPLGASAVAAPYIAIGAPWRLPAGRYRMHVFGSRPVEAILAVAGRGLPRRPLVATRPSTVSLGWGEAAGAGAPGVAYAQAPVTVGPRALSAAFALAVRHGVTDDDTTIETCLGTVTCLTGDGGVRHTVYERPEYAAWPARSTAKTVVGTYYAPGTPAPGDATAYAAVRTNGIVDRLVVAAFSLAL